MAQQTYGRGGWLAGWLGHWRKAPQEQLPTGAVPVADIDELSQEVFLRLLRYTEEVAAENPKGHLFRIAANVANEWRERSRAEARGGDAKLTDQKWLEELRIEPEAAGAEDVPMSPPAEELQALVNELPARQRAVLLLHVNEGLTYKEIAARLGTSSRGVLHDLTSAYTRLRLQMREDS
jgi:RNA polymerase sigma-70 factor (ECF subfamily)